MPVLDFCRSRTNGTRVYRTELGVKPELLGYHCDLCRKIVPSTKVVSISKQGKKYALLVRRKVCKACEIKHTQVI